MSLERFISVKRKHWRNVLFTTKHAILVSITTIGVFFCTNIHLLINLQYNIDTNRPSNSTHGSCPSISLLRNWLIVSKN
jgi:hypothetical protein